MAQQDILIVEDEEDIVQLLKYNLEMEGFSVRHVANGDDVMPEIKSLRPDLVLLDVMLPGQGGIAVCKSIRASSKYAKIPIIMLTAKSQDHHVIAGLDAGANDYVTKPFNIGVLVARIQSCLRHKQDSSEESHSDYIEYANLELFLNDYPVY